MFKSFGPLELVLILGIVLLIFGAGKVPTIGRSLGQSFREFKKGITGADEEKAVTAKAAPKNEDSSTPLKH